MAGLENIKLNFDDGIVVRNLDDVIKWYFTVVVRLAPMCLNEGVFSVFIAHAYNLAVILNRKLGRQIFEEDFGAFILSFYDDKDEVSPKKVADFVFQVSEIISQIGIE